MKAALTSIKYESPEEYWKMRCEAAEAYIEASPCDPDIYPDQTAAYRKWQELKDTF